MDLVIIQSRMTSLLQPVDICIMSLQEAYEHNIYLTDNYETHQQTNWKAWTDINLWVNSLLMEADSRSLTVTRFFKKCFI
jgi:hypothetical protein